MIDFSRGKGKPINLETAIPLHYLLKDKFSIIFAGGLGSGNIEYIRKTISKKIGSEFSLDAQSQLFKNNNLYLEYVKEYLEKGSIFT